MISGYLHTFPLLVDSNGGYMIAVKGGHLDLIGLGVFLIDLADLQMKKVEDFRNTCRNICTCAVKTSSNLAFLSRCESSCTFSLTSWLQKQTASSFKRLSRVIWRGIASESSCRVFDGSYADIVHGGGFRG
jgi:hypothetical protein